MESFFCYWTSIRKISTRRPVEIFYWTSSRAEDLADYVILYPIHTMYFTRLVCKYLNFLTFFQHSDPEFSIVLFFINLELTVHSCVSWCRWVTSFIFCFFFWLYKLTIFSVNCVFLSIMIRLLERWKWLEGIWWWYRWNFWLLET